MFHMETVIFWGVVVVLVLAARGFRVINQYERGVILTLGKYSGTRNPGLTWIFLGSRSSYAPTCA